MYLSVLRLTFIDILQLFELHTVTLVERRLSFTRVESTKRAGQITPHCMWALESGQSGEFA